jgi:hypothetical protein
MEFLKLYLLKASASIEVALMFTEIPRDRGVSVTAAVWIF